MTARKVKVITTVVMVLVVVAALSRFENLNPILKHRRKVHCWYILKLLNDGVFSDALEKGWLPGKRLTDAEIADSQKYMPPGIIICPSGGHYEIRVVGQYPVCSYHGDLLALYGDTTADTNRDRINADW